MYKINNKTLGTWSVISEMFIENGEETFFCKCICGATKNMRLKYLSNKRIKTCPCSSFSKGKNFQGVGDLSKAYYTSFYSSRMLKGKYFDKENITIEYLWDLFLKQNKKCAISGLEINLLRNWSNYNNCKVRGISQTASIDRIDSSKDYVIGNIQWVHKTINYMKGSMSDEDFIKICSKVALNNKDFIDFEKLEFGWKPSTLI
jgi:hypothetical protein